MTVALIDGDGLVYRCGFAVEKTYYLLTGLNDEYDCPIWPPIFHSAKEAKEASTLGSYTWTRKEVEPLDHCLATVRNSLEKTLKITGASNHKLYIGGTGNFRTKLYPEYKANRAALARPTYYDEIRDYLVKHWDAEIVNGYEADDALGVLACGLYAGDCVLVSQDKDLRQIPGRHYNWVTGEFCEVTPEQGMRFFYEQVISGDATDNIPGLKGFGPKKAQAIIEGAKSTRELAEAVYKAYGEHFGYSTDSALDLRNVDQGLDLMASLVWIWRKPEDRHPVWRHLGRQAI